jgi:hypothetical protein
MPTPRKYKSGAERQVAYRLRCKEREMTLAGPVPLTMGRKRWRAMLGRALHLVEQAHDEMQDYYDGKSETWQDSERGEAFAETMESVADIVSELNDIPTL